MQVLIVYNAPGENSDDDDPDLVSEVAVQDEVHAVYEAVSQLGHAGRLLPLSTLKEAMNVIHDLKPDVIFNLCEGFHGVAQNEMHIASLWELSNIPYTGNTPLTLGLAQDKVLTKHLLESRKIHTPAFQVFDQIPEKVNIDFPLIAKPSREDASLGIGAHAVVTTLRQLRSAVRSLLEKFNQPVLVEHFISGREFNISVIGNPPRVLAIAELDFSGLSSRHAPIASYEAKWMTRHVLYRKTPVQCPARISPELKQKLEDVAVQVYNLLGGRDYGRVDTRMDEEGRIYVLEYNPNPDISEDAGFSKAVRSAGLSYAQFVEQMISNAINRKRK